MGRWRKPNTPAAPYITASGYRTLENEVKVLWDRRHGVVKHLAAAAAEGDRSENAEYIYRKKELGEIDRRIGYLQKRMPKLKVVNEVPVDLTRVFFNAIVETEDGEGVIKTYRIVGSDEARPQRGEISIDSPVAKALLGRSLGDTVDVVLEDKRVDYVIIDIDYPVESKGRGV